MSVVCDGNTLSSTGNADVITEFTTHLVIHILECNSINSRVDSRSGFLNRAHRAP